MTIPQLSTVDVPCPDDLLPTRRRKTWFDYFWEAANGDARRMGWRNPR